MPAVRGAGLLALLLLAAPASIGAVRSAKQQPGETTPVKKVIDLLKKLNVRIQEDGKKEAAQFEKYAHFCRVQDDEKNYAIDKSEKIIEKQTAEIDKLSSEITEHDDKVTDLETEITDLQKEIDDLTETRSGEHETYKTDEASISKALDAIKRATAALKNSKGKMEGKVAKEKALLLLAKFSKTAHQAFLDLAKPGESANYQYHSNDIIAILEKLYTQFTETKNRLDEEEFQANSEYEMKTGGLTNQRKALEKEKAQQEKYSAFKTEKKEGIEKDKTAEENARDADKDFVKVLTQECADRKEDFDKRTETRAEELETMKKAITTLESGVAPNYKANRMLVGLQKGQAPSFLQTSSDEHVSKMKKAVLASLHASADRLSSKVLALAAMRVQVGADHFVKVRSVIKDVIARLEEMAAEEATQKEFCDKEMEAAITARDTHAEEIESLAAQITEKEGLKKVLMQEIATLAKDIASNEKALMEATELRAEEKQDNENVMAEAEAGKEAVEYALQVLKDFYEGGSLIQKKTGYVPPDSDRSGKTVSDLAPEMYEMGYDGRKQASGSIIGLLEVILSDFERTHTTVDGLEKMSEEDFNTFKDGITADTDAKKGEKETKEGELTTIEDELLGLADDKKTAVNDHELALKELTNLRTMCVEGEESYKERTEKRQKEIEALKEAHNILENWQS